MPPTQNIHAGYLFKKGGFVKSIKKRWFILTSDCLTYYKNLESITDKPCIDKVPTRLMTGCNAGKLTPTVFDGKKCYEFLVHTKSRIYYLYASSEDERDMWLEYMTEAIRACGTSSE